MSGDAVTALDAGARAALGAKKSLTYVCPPATWAVGTLLQALPDAAAEGPRLVVITPEIGDVLALARTLRPLPGFEPILPVTGVARAARLLAAGAVRTLAVTLGDAVRLTEMSRLRLAGTPTVVLLWPEQILAAGDGALLDTLLAEAADAQRLFVTADPDVVRDLVERHARRSPLAALSHPPERPVVPVRYAVVEDERRAAAIRGVLDTLNPASALIWEPSPDRYERWVEFAEDPSVAIVDVPEDGRTADVVIATDLPSAEVLEKLSGAGREIVVLVRASQIAYLRRIASSTRSLRLPGASDRARERAHQLRQAVRDRIVSGDVSADLLALGPLFDEFEPALVAAALARALPAPAAEEPAGAPAGMAAWVRIRVGVGTRDKVRPADIVGAILNGVGLQKDHVGKVEIREGYSIVEVRAEDAPRALRGMAGLKVRGKALAARVGT